MCDCIAKLGKQGASYQGLYCLMCGDPIWKIGAFGEQIRFQRVNEKGPDLRRIAVVSGKRQAKVKNVEQDEDGNLEVTLTSGEVGRVEAKEAMAALWAENEMLILYLPLGTAATRG